MDELVGEIRAMDSGNLVDDKENPVGIDGSDEGVKVCEDEVSLREKPNDDPISGSGDSPSSVGRTKGKGLRKWRRIRREVVKDGSGSVGSSKAGKRGLSNSAPNPVRGQKSEGSLSPVGAVVRNLRNEVNGPILGPKVIAVEAADSENSEDWNSLSSTAASGSVMRNGGPALVAVMSEKKGANGVQQGKARVKNKIARGEREKVEKDNSISRSSNFVFVQGTNSVAHNGTQSGMIGKQDGENIDDEAQDGEKHIVNEVKAGTSKGNGVELEGLAEVDNQTSVTELDPLAKSIFQLQSTQEALEKEIQKLRETGDECQGTIEEDAHEASSSQLFNLGENGEIPPHYLKAHVNTLKQNVDVSESKLEEANSILKAKEARVTKLESEEIDAKIEDLFKLKTLRRSFNTWQFQEL